MLASDNNNSKCTKTLGDNKKTIVEANVLGGSGAMSGSLYNTLEKTTYKHWVDDYSQVWVQDSDPWSENVYSKYLSSVTRCNVCGECFSHPDYKDYKWSEDYVTYYNHDLIHFENNEGGGWSEQDLGGYDTIWHAAKGHWENTAISGHWDIDGGSESIYTRPEHTHSWQEQTQTLVYPAYDWTPTKTICNICGECIDYGAEAHIELVHGYRFENYDDLYKNVDQYWHDVDGDPIHWDDQTWTYITGYICTTCGETKAAE